MTVNKKLENRLKMLWDLKFFGIEEVETDVFGIFMKGISFKGNRYKVTLPWKEFHPILSSHHKLSV